MTLLLPPGTQVDLTNCEREPIHIPGSVQPHGVLLTVAAPDGPVLQVSANSALALGRAPEEVLGRRLPAVLGVDAAAVVAAAMHRDRDHEEASPLPLAPLALGARLFDGLLHRSGGAWVLELEPTREEPPAGHVFNRVRDVISELSRVSDVGRLLQRAAAHVRTLTGFDRVMVYRFDAEWNGEVVAEARRPDLEPFLGLHYPAGDIPPQARALYRVNWLRFIRDVDAVGQPLLPTDDPRTGAPLDLSRAALRSVSPIHCEYLRNMGVTASMSISLLVDGELAGLVACHHYSGAYVPTAATRATCEVLAQSISMLLGARERAERAARSAALGEALSAATRGLRGGDADPAATLKAHAPTLMRLVGATGMAWTLPGGSGAVGEVPSRRDLRRLRDLARGWVGEDGVAALDRVALLDPALEPVAPVASGLLMLHVAEGEDVLFLRPEAVHTVDWGGNPHLKVLRNEGDGVARLTPRGSFALWRETVRLRSRPWDEVEVEAAVGLRRMLLEVLAERSRALADVAVTLQRSLLPERLPQLPGWALAADYRPAAVGVGGDWYDAVVLPDGRLLLVLGDVAGHGLDAAGMMAQLRNALRAYAVEDPDPGRVLARVDRLVALTAPDQMATAVVAVLEPRTGAVRLAAAGHPVPVVCRDGGPWELLAVEAAPPLGAGMLADVAAPPTTTVCLGAGDALLLVSDGMFERRDQPLDESLARLADRALAAVVSAPGAAAPLQRLVGQRLAAGAVEDDATVLLLRRR